LKRIEKKKKEKKKEGKQCKISSHRIAPFSEFYVEKFLDIGYYQTL